LQRISDWCRRHLHEPMREQYQALQRKLQGHYQYQTSFCFSTGACYGLMVLG
jgi:hypothetical protein